MDDKTGSSSTTAPVRPGHTHVKRRRFGLRLFKPVNTRARLVFERVVRFYSTFNIIAALMGGLSLAILTFNEFHPTTGSLFFAAEGLLTASGLTSVVAIMMATMLLFKYEGFEAPTRLDLAISWIPLVLLDLSIVEVLLGLIMWYAGKNGGWRAVVMSSHLAALLTCAIIMATWMWQTMSKPGGLGRDETRIVEAAKKVAELWRRKGEASHTV